MFQQVAWWKSGDFSIFHTFLRRSRACPSFCELGGISRARPLDSQTTSSAEFLDLRSLILDAGPVRFRLLLLTGAGVTLIMSLTLPRVQRVEWTADTHRSRASPVPTISQFAAKSTKAGRADPSTRNGGRPASIRRLASEN